MQCGYSHCLTQACVGLAETGVADEATWRALLGPDLTPLAPDALGGSPSESAMAVNDPSVGAALQGNFLSSSIGIDSSSGGAPSEATPKWDSLFEWPAGLDSGSGNGSVTAADEEPTVAQPAGTTADAAPAKPAPRDWPVLRRDDGGDHVHHLHVRLAHEEQTPPKT